MIEFNSDHIIVGQIKEILSSFNLPKYKVYSKEIQESKVVPTIKPYKDSEGKMHYEDTHYVPYIKDNTIQYYVKSGQGEPYTYTWENTKQPFIYGQKVKNYTETLKYTGNIYDSHTHEYLGNYLRFKRDYENINLMPLYNCFSNRLCTNLNWAATDKTISFNTADKAYKIYMLPVNIFQKYTIAIDCAEGVEICCGLYGKYQEVSTSRRMAASTYARYRKMVFGQPILYDKLENITNPDDLSLLSSSNLNVKMFIKLPANIDSSIVVLEGDYRGYNDAIVPFKANKLSRAQNYTITNFDTKINNFSHFTPVTPLQLLRFNTKKQYPFADRLIEYLLGNAIDSSEEISDNIKRVQKVISLSADYKNEQGKKLIQELRPTVDGVWTDSIRPIVYANYNTNIKENVNDNNHDILGYIDKDIEKWYAAGADKNKVSISSIDLYTDKNGLHNEAKEEK